MKNTPPVDAPTCSSTPAAARFSSLVALVCIPVLLILLLFACLEIAAAEAAFAQGNPADVESSVLPRHPLERAALAEPDTVLKQLPELQQAARMRSDPEQLALLYLVEANACRVMANWVCQKQAGEEATKYALQAAKPLLQARGLIAQARGQIALGDFSRGERTLGRAELALKASPASELSADIDLAYSSLSYRLGKHISSADYARRGLANLGPTEALPMQVRLLRNHAKAMIVIGQLPEARESLRRAGDLLLQVDDPKLRAEIELEVARLAHVQKDTTTQLRAADIIETESALLHNSQLAGLAFEVRGMALMQLNEPLAAHESLSRAIDAFSSLGLIRDEQRALGTLLRIRQDRGEFGERLRRYLDLNDQISLRDRASAGDSFEDRLRYAEQELEILRLESSAALAEQQHLSAMQRLRFSFALSMVAFLLLLALITLYLAQRRWNVRLRTALGIRQRALLQTSHELRNPLSGVLSLTELLGKSALPAREARMIKVIEGSARHMEKLAQDLLDRGRLEAGELRLEPRPTNVSAVLRDLVSLYEPLAREKGLRLNLTQSRQMPTDLILDSTRLMQVLVNLVSNSLKFTESGGVRVSADCVPDRKSTERHQISFRVDDSGPGMTEAESRHLFEPFRKGAAGHRHQAGAGLGLAISHELISLMGGKLWVQSVLGQGASFGFELSVQRAPKAATADEATAPGMDPNSSTHAPAADSTGEPDLVGTPLRVASVDDDQDMLQMYQEVLSHLGASVAIFAGPDTLMADPDPAAWDLLIIDYELTQTNGAAVAWEYRQQCSDAAVPRIAVVSGHAAPELLPPGVDEWLQKPVELSRWIMLLASARHHRQIQRAAMSSEQA